MTTVYFPDCLASYAQFILSGHSGRQLRRTVFLPMIVQRRVSNSEEGKILNTVLNYTTKKKQLVSYLFYEVVFHSSQDTSVIQKQKQQAFPKIVRLDG